MGICFFIGHRDTPPSILLKLQEAVERHIVEYGVAEFVVGKYGGFDGSLYPDGLERLPRRAAIVRANRYMVCHSVYLIAYDAGRIGNTRKLVEYARRREAQGLFQVENPARDDAGNGIHDPSRQ